MPLAQPCGVWFPGWEGALARFPVSPPRRQEYRQAVIRFLHFCRETRQVASVPAARAFIETVQLQRPQGETTLATWKEALNWFFREGRRSQPAPGVSSIATGDQAAARATTPACWTPNGRLDVPPLAARDQGRSAWERRLIQTLRARKYQWRTEQSYRGWATRFTAWLERRGGRIEEVTAPQVRDFLTELATQRQAVNALVFLVREALGRDPGQFGDFVRARHRVRMPVVLSRAECQRLFAALQGTPRLMAELMYGSGLRQRHARIRDCSCGRTCGVRIRVTNW